MLIKVCVEVRDWVVWNIFAWILLLYYSLSFLTQTTSMYILRFSYSDAKAVDCSLSLCELFIRQSSREIRINERETETQLTDGRVPNKRFFVFEHCVNGQLLTILCCDNCDRRLFIRCNRWHLLHHLKSLSVSHDHGMDGFQFSSLALISVSS